MWTQRYSYLDGLGELTHMSIGFEGAVKAMYIRLGDWSFLNGDKTNFMEVFKH